MMEPMPGKKMLMMSISRPQDLVSIFGTSCPLRTPCESLGRRRPLGYGGSGMCVCVCARAPPTSPRKLAHVMSLMTSPQRFDKVRRRGFFLLSVTTFCTFFGSLCPNSVAMEFLEQHTST